MKKLLSVICLLAIGLSAINAQDPTIGRYGNDDVAKVLSTFKNYRYGSVWIYEVTSTGVFKEMFETLAGPVAGGGDDASITQFKADYPEAFEYTDKAIKEGSPPIVIIRELDSRGLPYDRALFDEAATAMTIAANNTTVEKEYKVYIVTSEPEGKITANPEKIYGAVVYSAPFVDMTDNIEENLKGQQEMKNVFSYKRLLDDQTPEAKYIQSRFPIYNNMYQLLDAQFQQGNTTSRTMAARNIGDPAEIQLIEGGDLGVSTSVIDNPTNPTERDIQAFKRISNGEAMDFTGRYEVTASPDLISWKMYDQNVRRSRRGEVVIDTVTGLPVLDTRYSSNDNLPSLGFELKYGIDDVNYYSLWSNRLAFNAIWDNMKIGVILPTTGWAGMSEDVYDQKRELTTAGFGINGEIDFPFPIIQNSGIFNASFGYNFGDADPAVFRDQPDFSSPFGGPQLATEYGADYAMRLNAQLLYTFAIAIDNDYLLRFGMGGTVYTVEEWGFQQGEVSPQMPIAPFNYVNNENGNETIGGITGRLEFLAQDDTNPYGGSVQYFDKQIGYEAWMQFNVIDQRLAFKALLMGYSNLFRDAYEWELDNMFMPTVRAIYTF